ncbi:retrovirus-related Pol polyprotein from transposon 412 [Trichonephila clavipes]|nr:retrovirus-related Pol polyprotein from transposon 412 [Trichonephila clavipes]
MNLKDPSGRLARWALRLQEHDFDVKYKTGKKHSDADALSRNPVEEETETPDKFLAVTTNGKLWLPVIPKHLRADILRHFHDAPTAGHLGFAKTYDRIRKRFYWPGMYRNVVRYVMHCRECKRRKSVPQRPPGRLVPIPPAIAPFHRIGIDLLGRFPKSAHGNKWIIVCTDYSTRYAITKALPTAEVDEVAKFLLEEIVLRHGAPRVIITDRGAVFRSRLVSSLVDLCNIDHRFTTAYHPQTNGLTERFNKTLADMLSMYVHVEQKNWDEILPFVTFAYNTAKQETTGFTPFYYLLHGREAETTLDTTLPFCPNDFDDNNITKIAARAEESRQLARVHSESSRQRSSTLRFQTPNGILRSRRSRMDLYSSEKSRSLRKTLKKVFRTVSGAPYQVLRRLSAVTYAVQDFDPASRKRKLREVVHVLRMKPYHDPAEQIETEDIPPKESYKEPITRSRIKTLEQNDSGALSSFRGQQCRTHNLLQVPIAELAERWTELPQVSDESRSFFRVHTGYFSNIPKCIKAEFIASWACSQSSVVSSSQRTFSRPDARFTHIHIDIVGPLSPSYVHHYLLTIIDQFSRWQETIPIPGMRAKTICLSIFDTWISRFGCLSIIISDQGTQMRSSMFAEFTHMLKTQKIKTSPYHPISKGAVERFHHHLKSAIKAHENDRWSEIVPIILHVIRTAVKDLQSCAEIVYGINLRLPSDMTEVSDFSSCDNDFIIELRNAM